VAELAEPGDGVEDPEALAGAHVVAADVALDVRLAARNAAGAVRGTDDDDVVADHRGGMKADFTSDRVDLLIVLRLQIDDAVDAEPGNGIAVLRVERDEAIAGRDVEDSLFATVGPVREAATREHPGRTRAARSLDLTVHPQQLTGGRVERHDGSASASG